MGLVWRDQLSVGNQVIDSDHKNLIEIINKIEQSLAKKDIKNLSIALKDLHRYAQEHFDREEFIAKTAGYARVLHLHESHKKLQEKLDQLMGEIGKMEQNWSSDKAEHIAQFVHDWFINHVIKEDLLMKSVLQQHSYYFDPRT